MEPPCTDTPDPEDYFVEPPPTDQAPHENDFDHKTMTNNCRTLGEALAEAADKLGDKASVICIEKLLRTVKSYYRLPTNSTICCTDPLLVPH
ncbi:hypothetical protein Pmani_023461 [Petrolisthes manimaculis]|uniref:Uncharacterized protein n=1 Tax=Petrolisthes manimaculis TaxID=1843537 RepID=A0AAE1PCC1_9EUCA|nr:hypothetical protein Pmani_023461 [Petrolisthes manimaculis]